MTTVTKPVNPELLMAALGRWARRPAAGTIAVTGAGGDSAPLDDLPSLDTRAGVRRIGGKVAAYRRQLARFRARYAGAVDELERQLAAEGVAAAEAYCHAALKGVAGNLRAQDLYQQIAAIDADLKEGQPPAAAALAALRARLAEVLADIDRLAAAESADTSGEAARDTGPPPLTPSRVQELLAALDQALQLDLGAAEPLLETLRTGMRGTPLESAFAALAAQVDVFTIDAARQSLAALSLRMESAPQESPP